MAVFRASILATFRIAQQPTSPVIDLGFFSRYGEDDCLGLRDLCSAQFVYEASNALIAAVEVVVGNQVLPDRSCIATAAQSQHDRVSKRLAATPGSNLWF